MLRSAPPPGSDGEGDGNGNGCGSGSGEDQQAVSAALLRMEADAYARLAAYSEGFVARVGTKLIGWVDSLVAHETTR